MSQFVYHFKPKNMVGDLLIPLNQLRDKHPKTYAEHVTKYKGREKLLEETIPLLNCLWNDVLHISPIHPQIVIDTWRQEGLYSYAGIPEQIEVYKIPVDLLKEETTVCYQSFNFDFNSYNPELDKFWSFQSSLFQEQTKVDPKQLDIWKSDYNAGRMFMWYSHTMHILAKQEIDITSCELITCR